MKRLASAMGGRSKLEKQVRRQQRSDAAAAASAGRSGSGAGSAPRASMDLGPPGINGPEVSVEYIGQDLVEVPPEAERLHGATATTLNLSFNRIRFVRHLAARTRALSKLQQHANGSRALDRTSCSVARAPRVGVLV